jgi:hypothetical protein
MGRLRGSWLQQYGFTGPDWLIETGTLTGKSAKHAAPLFKFVHTIEVEPRYYLQALARLSKVPNVAMHLGDSRTMLPRIINPAVSTTFWLDAHYDGVEDSKAPQPPPLLEELEIIFTRPWSAAYNVLIDDAEKFEGDWFWKRQQAKHHTRAFWPDGSRVRDVIARHGKMLEEIRTYSGMVWAVRSTL